MMFNLTSKLWNLRLYSSLAFSRSATSTSQPAHRHIRTLVTAPWSSPGTLLTAEKHIKRDVRRYNPARHIDWVGIKRRWRSKQLFMKKKKLKNHPRVALRFRLTRFGWERLQQGRRGPKLHMSGQKRRNKKRIKFVSRHDLSKLTRQMPGHRLRIRDPPINNNPNIQRLRHCINSYFA